LKKVLFMIGLLFCMMAIGGTTEIVRVNTGGVAEACIEAPLPDETLIETILQKTYATVMIFSGSDANWACVYTVWDTVSDNPDAPGLPKIKVVILPQFTYSKYYIHRFNYVITTSRGELRGEKWLRSKESFMVEACGPVPTVDEVIKVVVEEWYQSDCFEIANIIPEGIISPEQAFRKTFAIYYRTYGAYPTADFTFKIEFYDREYWLVSWDDNDGVGGESFLLVNAFTGEAGDIKEDEG
jgi:hypothetical protein